MASKRRKKYSLQDVIIATLKSRIVDIDYEILNLREQQKGLESALSIAEGSSPRVDPGDLERRDRVRRLRRPSRGAHWTEDPLEVAGSRTGRMAGGSTTEVEK